VLAGVLAVALQVFFSVDDAPAYGVCMACHGRDLVTLGSQAGAIGLPLLTTVGVVLGAALASRRHGERRVRRPRAGRTPAAWTRQSSLGLVAGFGSLLALGCPTRLWLRVGHGDATVLPAVLALVAGVVVATLTMRRWASHG